MKTSILISIVLLLTFTAVHAQDTTVTMKTLTYKKVDGK